jgi:hypothetical protein
MCGRNKEGNVEGLREAEGERSKGWESRRTAGFKYPKERPRGSSHDKA